MKRAVHGVTKSRLLGKFLIGKDGGKEHSWQQGHKGMKDQSEFMEGRGV